MTFKKKLFTYTLAILSISISSPTLALDKIKQIPDTNTFLESYQKNVQYILKNYTTDPTQPLDAQIFDIANNSYLGFLSSSKGYRKPEGDILAMMYYDRFQVNQKNTSFCFILYDSKKNLLINYLKNTQFNYEETITYLTLHEMGHCLYAYENQIKKREKITAKENEQLADMFSIAYFSILGQKNNAVKIIRPTRRIDPKDIHANSSQLEQFFVLFNELDNIQQYDNFNKIFDISYQLFQEIKDSTLN